MVRALEAANERMVNSRSRTRKQRCNTCPKADDRSNDAGAGAGDTKRRPAKEGQASLNEASSSADQKEHTGGSTRKTKEKDRMPRKKSKLNISDVSDEDLRLVSETSFECIECVESLIKKAKSIHAPHDLRDLSLTLASLERQLYNYVSDHLLRSRKRMHNSRSSGLLGLVGGGKLGASRRVQRHTLQAALRRATEMLDDGHIPLICGGVASLMHNLKGALLETKQCVKELSSVFYASTQDALIVSAVVLLAAAGFYKVTGWLQITMQVLSVGRRVRWNGPMKVPLGIQLNIKANGWLGLAVWLWRRAYDTLRTIQPGTKGMVSLMLATWLVKTGMRIRSMAKLRACNRQLLLLQRMFNCVTFALDEARMRRAKSYVELVAYPCPRRDIRAKQVMQEVPAARLLVESVAYPCEPYLHQYTHGRHWLLKKALDVLYSSTGVAFELANGRWWLASIITQISLPYFIMHPRGASSYATGVRQHMSPEFFRFLCFNSSNAAVIYFCFSVLLRHFETKVRVKLKGVPSTFILKLSGPPPPCAERGVRVGIPPWKWKSLWSEKPDCLPMPPPERLPSTPQGGPVLIYCHGGGFCCNLLPMDIPFIAMIGEAVRTAPIVVSTYSLAPEKPFPHALNEICTTYEWVRAGGLGFYPSRVVLAGESAGANFILALCVRYVAAHFPSLKEDAGADHQLLRGAPEVRAAMPDEIIVGYPAVNLGASPSPSRALHMCDPILPIAAGNLAKAYHGEDIETLLHPQVSPIYTTDAVLSHFPPTNIMTGGMDILLDDAVDFHVRLRRNGTPGNFRIFRTLPHGFWGLGDILPEAKEAQRLGVQWIKRALYPSEIIN
mmetsp:Transcript_20826/g.37096  ORF Transcript_20826/g.37096 Transcript_20826/m.37096 type:complete len:840 (+) Transcript_20826:139-2658(+)